MGTELLFSILGIAIQYWPVTLAIIVGVTLLFLGVRAWGRRRLSAMGFQTAIEMDGATCLKADDGSVVFRRSSGDAWLGILILGALELTLLLGVTLGHWSLALLIGLLIGCLLIGLALFFAVRFLLRRKPYIYINANSRTLERGTQQIPFSRISRIRTTPPTTSILGGETSIRIQVTLDNGEVIDLGSVSGNLNKARTRATAITQFVAEATGAAIQESDGNIESIESIRKRMPSLQPQVTHKQGKIRLILIGMILLLLSMLIMLLSPQR